MFAKEKSPNCLFVWSQTLLCIGSWLNVQSFGIMLEEVCSEYTTNTKQLLCVQGWPVEKPLQSAFGHTDTVHKPFVGVSLAAEFVADKVANVYLHCSCLFVARAAYREAWQGGDP